MSVQRLHAKQNDGFARPAERLQNPERAERVAQQRNADVLEPERNPLRAGPAAGQNGSQKAHRVGAVGIADGFNVRVLVDIDAGADGDAL